MKKEIRDVTNTNPSSHVNKCRSQEPDGVGRKPQTQTKPKKPHNHICAPTP